MSRAARIALRVVLGVGVPPAVACSAATVPADTIKSDPTKSVATTNQSSAGSASASASPSASGSASSSASGSASGDPDPWHAGGKVVAIYGSSIIVIQDRVSFPIGSAVVDKKFDGMLGAVSDIMKSRPTWFIAIEARADIPEGWNAASRKALSQKRGEAIVARLKALGADVSRLRIQALGDTKPIDSKETNEGRERNRATSFSVELADGSKPQ